MGTERQDFQDFESFYSAYYQKALCYVLKKVGSMQEAEDIICSVFMYCFEHFSSFDPQRASIGTWLYIVINSRLKNWYRDRKPNISIEEAEDLFLDKGQDALLEESVILQEQRDAIAKALLKLSERERKIVVYRYFKSMHADEIAEIMDMTPNNVRVVLSRAIDKMADLFEEPVRE